MLWGKERQSEWLMAWHPLTKNVVNDGTETISIFNPPSNDGATDVEDCNVQIHSPRVRGDCLQTCSPFTSFDKLVHNFYNPKTKDFYITRTFSNS